MQAPFQPCYDTNSLLITLGLVLRVPDIVRNKLFYRFAPWVDELSATVFGSEFADESIDILNQDIVSSYQDLIILGRFLFILHLRISLAILGCLLSRLLNIL